MFASALQRTKNLGQLFRKFSHHSLTPGMILLGRNKTMAQIITRENQTGLMASIISEFQGRGIDLYSINGKIIEKLDDGKEVCSFELSFLNEDEDTLKTIQNSLSKRGFSFRIIDPPIVDWFPTNLEQLDKIGHHLREPDLLDLYDDPHKKGGNKYILRRSEMLEKLKDRKMIDPLHDEEWYLEEHDLWQKAFANINEHRKSKATKNFNKNFDVLVKEGLFNEKKIPKLKDLNAYMADRTNWRIKPIAGALTHREFLNALALRTFCINHFVRDHEQDIEFHAESDLLHHILGHIPNLLNPTMCDILHRIGELSLGASDSQIGQLAAIFWYTMEFGLMKEDGKIKFIGGAFSANPKHIKDFVNVMQEEEKKPEEEKKVAKLNLKDHYLPFAEFRIKDTLSQYYFLEGGIEDLDNQVKLYMKTFYKPFGLRFNFGNNSYEVDRAVYLRLPEQKELERTLKKETRFGIDTAHLDSVHRAKAESEQAKSMGMAMGPKNDKKHHGKHKQDHKHKH